MTHFTLGPPRAAPRTFPWLEHRTLRQVQLANDMRPLTYEVVPDSGTGRRGLFQRQGSREHVLGDFWATDGVEAPDTF